MMKPDFERDGIKLYCADCMDVLPHLSGVGAVVTDPPFGIGFKYESHDDSESDYESLITRLVSEINRMGVTGAVVVWQAMKHANKWHRWFPEGFRIFAACKGFVQFRPTPIQFSWDPVIFWGHASGDPSVIRKDFHLQNLAPFGFGREKIEHPCPRPVEQVQYVIETFTIEGETVLDPFLGSGTTGVACVKLGRKFIGIEKEPKYFDIAVKRIERALSEERSSLFPVSKEIQRELI